MSYDVSIYKDNQELFWRNYTSNSSKLFYEHLDTENGIKCLNGKTGSEAALLIAPFWEKLNAERLQLWEDGVIGEPKLSHKYDTYNGWGSLIGALIFIGEIQAACIMYPAGIVHVSA